ncbi:MAG: biopolymer transporter ExbD [Myxococcaceae bacterium]|nr:biopolymer transporter ExbD [Myxococcaceae bacterium]MCI0673492.1 biopolymer transporter ExbD [Myxococcaceae bacterium]
MTTRALKSLVLPQTAPRADINVTPLVDVVLVLLIIFMVVTPIIAKDLAVELPQREESVRGPPPAQQVVVGVTAEGRLTLNDAPVADADYVPRLTELMRARTPAHRVAFFVPDDRASYWRLIAAIDGAKAAGVETLGMVVPPPTESR